MAFMKLLTVGHPHAGPSVLATHEISDGKSIGEYYDFLVYTDLSKQLLSVKEYGEKTCSCGKVATQFCAIAFIHNARKLA